MKSKISLLVIAALAVSSLVIFQGCTDTAEPSGTIENVPVTDNSQPVATETPSTETPAPSASESTLSALLNNPGYQAYLNLQIGATKDDVEAVLGTGTKMETDTFDGAGTEKYEYAKDGMTMWLSFREGKLFSKSSKENKDWSTPITAEQFAQLKNEMTLQEVFALIGEGQLLNENHQYAESLGEVKKTYFWNVKSGYQSVTLTFKNDKVSYISDMNMD